MVKGVGGMAGEVILRWQRLSGKRRSCEWLSGEWCHYDIKKYPHN